MIAGGNEYAAVNQYRLKSGVYTRKRENGELESQFNVIPGKGRGFHLAMEPRTSIFRIRLGNSERNLYPWLKEVGVEDSRLEDAWGKDILKANKAARDPKAINNIYERVIGKRADRTLSQKEKAMAIYDKFKSSELNPEVTKITLGKPYHRIGRSSIIDATKRILNVNRGIEEPDDRDSLRFRTFHGVEDFLSEKITKDAGRLQKTLMRKLDKKRSLKAMPAGYFTPQLKSLLQGDARALPLEEINPIDLLDQQQRAIALGEGGLTSQNVPKDARNVHSSQFSMIDPIRGPECADASTEVLTRYGWKKWPDVTEEDELACKVNGRLEFHTPIRVITEDYSGLMYGVKTKYLDYLVTPGHRMMCRACDKHSKYRYELAEKVHESDRLHSTTHIAWEGNSDYLSFILPKIERKGNALKKFGPFAIGPWAEFMGWWLSEGYCSRYVTYITQYPEVNPEKCERIAACLDELKFKWNKTPRNKDFTICGKQLTSYLKQFGKSYEKYIPRDLLEAPLFARRRLLSSLLAGDGRVNATHTAYCTTSYQLACDVQFLAISLGYSTNFNFEPDEREERYHGCYVVSLHKQEERCALNSKRTGLRNANCQHYYVKEYSGKVYCAEVPGGLLFTRRGRGIGFWSGNSAKIGIDVRLAHNTYKGDNKQIYTKIRNVRTGKVDYIDPNEMATKVVAFPGEMNKKGRKVKVMKHDKIEIVDKRDVDYTLDSASEMFALSSNLVPMVNSVSGNRLLMAGKAFAQTLPLVNGEAPLVQSKMYGSDKSFEDYVGRKIAAHVSKVDGTVEKITKDHIILRDHSGKKHQQDLYNNFPFNRQTFINANKIKVRPGQRVKAGDLLASTNFADNNGTLAVGKNLRVAYLPYKGYGSDDGIVISESAAKKLTSEHLYAKDLKKNKGNIHDLNRFVSYFPTTFTREQTQLLDNNGVIKPGMKVQPGDPLILSMKKKTLSSTDMLLGKIHKNLKNAYEDGTVTWDQDYGGEVVDVTKTNKGFKVNVKMHAPAKVADKLSGRYGNKGVVSIIVPDAQMPHTKDGKPMEVLLNPLGVISRINPAQAYEAVLGKIARKTGKPIKVEGFAKESNLDMTKRLLKKHNISDTEDLIDPITGKTLPKILTGESFMLKISKTAKSGFGAREIGPYTSEELPAKGGKAGAKRIGNMELNALLSYGALENIRDAFLIKGQKNQDFWRAMRLGHPLPSPKTPFVYTKFKNALKASGINIKKSGNTDQLLPLTDKDTLALSKGRIDNSLMFRRRDLQPEKGGLFDIARTGGARGERWSHIDLDEPIPNPVMEEPVRRLLGGINKPISQKRLYKILAHEDTLYGQSGGKALKNALSRINVEKAIGENEQFIKSGRKAGRNNAVKNLGYLKMLKNNNINPQELIISKLPVIPPIFRPITFRGEDTPVKSASNELYKDVIKINEQLRALKKDLPEDTLGQEKLGLYNAVKAVTGLGSPVSPQAKQKNLKGFLKEIVGNDPKSGMIQFKLLGKPQDVAGRAVIVPDPTLDINEVGLPKEMAWSMYKPFMMRDLVQRGLPAVQANQELEERTTRAHQALDRVIKDRPVLVNRAPTLHKFSIMALKPKLRADKSMALPPLIEAGFNADHDGDALQVHIPVTEGARQEALDKMLPTKNLFALPQSVPIHVPVQEANLGLFQATNMQKHKRVQKFKSREEAMDAYHRGEISINDPIEVS